MGKLVQFEMSAVNLALSLREQIRRQRLCITDEFPTPAGPAVVSRIEWPLGWVRATADENKIVFRREPFNDDPFVVNLPGKRVQLVQPADVTISSIAQLTTADRGAPLTLSTIRVELVFSLRVIAVENDVFLSLGFQALEGVPDGTCPCRKLTLGYIDGAVRPKLARPTFDRRSGRRGGSARPSAVISACGPRCNILDTI